VTELEYKYKNECKLYYLGLSKELTVDTYVIHESLTKGKT